MGTLGQSRATALIRWLCAHPYLLAGVLIFSGYLVPFCARVRSEWEEVYVRTAAHLRAGHNIYQQSDGYLYPPFMALLAVPFTYMPHLLSRLIWYGINIGCMAVLLRSAWHASGGTILEGGKSGDRSEHWICLLGLGCGVWYSFHAMAHQQTDLLIGALVLGGCALLQQGRSLRGAACFGLAAAMKCTALLWVPYLVLRGRWRAALCLVAVAGAVNLLPDLVHRPATGGTWLGSWYATYIRPMTNKQHVPGVWGSSILYNQSLSGAVNRWLLTDWTWGKKEVAIQLGPDPDDPGRLKLLVHGAEAFLFIAAALLFLRRPVLRPGIDPNDRDWAAWEYSIIVSLMLLFSPMSSIPHFCTLVLPGFCLARRAVRQGEWWTWTFLVLAVFAAALSNKDLWGARIYTVALWHGAMTWNTLFLLAACLLALLFPADSKAIQQPLAETRRAA